ncbi:MAG: YeeE/YedE thiosulfate transporter family protein [Pirellulaceae bacterium]|nr:YeeE/YedE family protein [Planctomycetales bacterium]
MAPFNPVHDFGKWPAYGLYFVIGLAFGFILESAGFGNSRKLAAQFYFTELTVLKVMFGAIIVAMVGIFGTSALGWLDYNVIWVNPTYLWPGILGGLIMGVGFILGGFCPGTSLVAMATAKVDGIFFVLGVLFGIFLFGETVDHYAVFFNSSYYGRFTLMDLLGLPAGWIVLGVVVMALGMFWGAEQSERVVGGRDLAREPRWRYGAAMAMVLLASLVMIQGQPTTEDRWNFIAAEKDALLEQRSVQIEPVELISLMHDKTLRLTLLDVRSEADYNQFHLRDAIHVPLSELVEYSKQLQLVAQPAVFVVIGNDEVAATEAWRFLQAETVPNVYLLSGGINGWLDRLADESLGAMKKTTHETDELAYLFPVAFGDRLGPSHPSLAPQTEFEPKVKLQRKKGPTGGGCG